MKKVFLILLFLILLVLILFLSAYICVTNKVNCSASKVDTSIKAQLSEGENWNGYGLTNKQINNLISHPEDYREIYIEFDINNHTGLDLKNLQIKNNDKALLGKAVIMTADRSEVAIPSGTDNEAFVYILYTAVNLS